MDQNFEVRYDADAADVFAMITDDEFLAKKLMARGAVSHDVAVEPTPDGGASIRTEQVLPARVADFVRRFVGETIRVQQTDVWGRSRPDGSRDGTFAVEIAGVPAKMTGTLRLEPAGDGATVERLAGTITVSIPVVGGKLEQMAGDAVRAAVETERRVGRDWLATKADGG
jgi:uncharacterized protein YndB with AHSA1/START domain